MRSFLRTGPFSHDEREELERLLAAPERVEIHGSNRFWRAHLLGAIMATAAMSFGPVQAATAEPAPSFVPGAQATPPGSHEPLVAAAMRRAGALEIATATRSTQVAMFPFPYRATLAGAELRGQVRLRERKPGLASPSEWWTGPNRRLHREHRTPDRITRMPGPTRARRQVKLAA